MSTKTKRPSKKAVKKAETKKAKAPVTKTTATAAKKLIDTKSKVVAGLKQKGTALKNKASGMAKDMAKKIDVMPRVIKGLKAINNMIPETASADKTGKKAIPSKKSAPAAGKKAAQKPAKKAVATPVITHGADHHFIPIHVKNAPTPIHDVKKEEKIFHNREEVALHQENQKVKANLASRMGRKKVYRILGR